MSDSYRALTRTYRPRTFDDIVSQEHVSNTLKNAISQNRLAHAYMFSGPRGVGKTTMARVLARAVNEIDNEVDGESLNQTLNVVEIDAASNNGVDDIRDLRERVRIPPQNGRYKIYIIDEVHMLSKQAFNALLKTLEEPPEHVIFIFATTEPHKVLPTILSRVQRFDFRRIRLGEIVARLQSVANEENITIDLESLHVIAKKADGALRDALGLLDQAIAFCGNEIRHEELLRALNVVGTDRMFQFMDAVERHDASGGLELIHDLLQEGYDIQEYLIGLTEHLRNLYVAKSSDKMYLVEASDEMKKRYLSAAESFTEDDLMRMLHILNEAQYRIRDAHQPKIQFEITLLKLIHMERTRNLNALLGELEALKKKLGNGEAVIAPATGESPRNGSATGSESAVKTADSVNDHRENKASDESPSSPPEPPEETNGQQAAKAPDAADNQPDAPAPQAHTAETESADVGPKAEQSQGTTDAVTQPAAETDSEKTDLATKQAKTASEETDVATAEQPEAENADSFGTPSLGTRPSASHTNGSTAPKETVSEKETVDRIAPEELDLETIKDCWDTYVEDLRRHVPQILFFQMQRIQPISLQKADLVLQCQDDFSKQIVDENRRQLGKLLEEKIGVFLNLKCRVRKAESSGEDTMSPWERFKKLQERDPKIRKLVELFGAELDYNLNQ